MSSICKCGCIMDLVLKRRLAFIHSLSEWVPPFKNGLHFLTVLFTGAVARRHWKIKLSRISLRLPDSSRSHFPCSDKTRGPVSWGGEPRSIFLRQAEWCICLRLRQEEPTLRHPVEKCRLLPPAGNVREAPPQGGTPVKSLIPRVSVVQAQGVASELRWRHFRPAHLGCPAPPYLGLGLRQLSNVRKGPDCICASIGSAVKCSQHLLFLRHRVFPELGCAKPLARGTHSYSPANFLSNYSSSKRPPRPDSCLRAPRSAPLSLLQALQGTQGHLMCLHAHCLSSLQQNMSYMSAKTLSHTVGLTHGRSPWEGDPIG